MVDRTSRDIPEWIKEALPRVCIVCGSTDNIEYHHILPISSGGKTTLENVVPMCRKCHKKKHADADRKTLRSAYISDRVWNDLNSIAQYRAFVGEKNSRGQPIGVGTLLNIAATEYVQRHKEDANKWAEMLQVAAEHMRGEG
jgi:hypothetical protein